MADDPAAPSADRIEPGVRRFVDAVQQGYARRPDLAGLTPAQARRLAEEVRAPWREGGPRMAAITERRVPVGDHEVRIRIYDPRGGSGEVLPNGALVYMHGGGWTLFSLDTHDRLMREYAARSGLAVIGVDYALAPEARFPVALEEVVGVVCWLQREGGEVGVDAGRLAIGGDSAGANLALAASLMLREANTLPRLRAMALNYGAFQTTLSPTAARRYGGAGFMLTAEEMAGFWAQYLRGPTDARDPLACPILADLAGLPPAFLAIAECDVLAEQNLLMAERLQAAGVATEAHVYRGATHSFLEAVSISPLSDRALAETSAWLAARCE